MASRPEGCSFNFMLLFCEQRGARRRRALPRLSRLWQPTALSTPFVPNDFPLFLQGGREGWEGQDGMREEEEVLSDESVAEVIYILL